MKKQDFTNLLKLLSHERIRVSSNKGDPDILRATESDKGRVINAAAFRRLQQKAQVFPLEPNAAVRTRLSHSIEVSQIGRYIAQKVIELSGNTDNDYRLLTSFINTVETACLLHDIGNPPFGHLGEAAVREWFSNKAKNKNKEFKELVNFDGNPQGFRLASFLSGYDEHGLNLTSSLLLSTVKYPCHIDNKQDFNKIGLFQANISTYELACEQVGWQKKYTKFPIMYLMDVADEIAYSISDLEDGLEKGIITEEQIKLALQDHKEIDMVKEYIENSADKGAIRPFIKFKTSIINSAVKEVAGIFITNIGAILAGSNSIKIIQPNEQPVSAILDTINSFARENIYSNKSAEKVELAGRSIIKGLFNHFGELLDLSDEEFKAITRGDRKFIKSKSLEFMSHLYNYLPKNYCEKYDYIDNNNELNSRAHLIVDFISGMTDDFALETYQILEGIRIK